MIRAYSLYEAKTRFSEVIRVVRAGRTVRITYRGKDVAEVRPITPESETIGERIARMTSEGVLTPARKPMTRLRPVARRRGALARFLAERD